MRLPKAVYQFPSLMARHQCRLHFATKASEFSTNAFILTIRPLHELRGRTNTGGFRGYITHNHPKNTITLRAVQYLRRWRSSRQRQRQTERKIREKLAHTHAKGRRHRGRCKVLCNAAFASNPTHAQTPVAETKFFAVATGTRISTLSLR